MLLSRKGLLIDDRKVKIVTFVVKFGCQGSINVMFEVKVKQLGSRFRGFFVSLTTSSTGYIKCKKLPKFLLFSDKTSSI